MRRNCEIRLECAECLLTDYQVGQSVRYVQVKPSCLLNEAFKNAHYGLSSEFLQHSWVKFIREQREKVFSCGDFHFKERARGGNQFRSPLKEEDKRGTLTPGSDRSLNQGCNLTSSLMGKVPDLLLSRRRIKIRQLGAKITPTTNSRVEHVRRL